MAKFPLPGPAEPIDDRHAFAETRNMNATDQRIRAAGYKIHARPKRGEVVWIDPRGATWTQAEVLRLLRDMDEERGRMGGRVAK